MRDQRIETATLVAADSSASRLSIKAMSLSQSSVNKLQSKDQTVYCAAPLTKIALAKPLSQNQ